MKVKLTKRLIEGIEAGDKRQVFFERGFLVLLCGSTRAKRRFITAIGLAKGGLRPINGLCSVLYGFRFCE